MTEKIVVSVTEVTPVVVRLVNEAGPQGPQGPQGESGETPDVSAKLDRVGGTITNYSETVNAATTSDDITLDLSSGNVQRITLDDNRQITMPADPGAVSQSFVLIIECAGFTPTWNTSPSIEWLTSDGAAPTLVTTADLVNVLTFIWDDVDSRWLGFLAGSETA